MVLESIFLVAGSALGLAFGRSLYISDDEGVV